MTSYIISHVCYYCHCSEITKGFLEGLSIPMLILLTIMPTSNKVLLHVHMKKEKNLSPSQGLNLGLPNTSQMLLPLRHQDS